jgi:AraC-like DNA-binding protein
MRTPRTIASVRQTLVMVGTLTESTNADLDTPKLLDTRPGWFYGVVALARRQVLRLKMRGSRCFENARRFSAGVRYNSTTNDFPFREMWSCGIEKGNWDKVMSETSSSLVRGEWLYEAARVSQEILCAVRGTGCEASEVVDALAQLPTPNTPLERLVRQGLIFDVLLGCVHDRTHSHDERTVSVVHRVLETSARPSPLLDSPESRAASLIRARAAERLDVQQLARAIGCHETQLRRSFRERFGISMRDFHKRCRVASAITLFADGESKTTAVARSVGYRSEKNFYRALRNVTGKKPTEVKSMSRHNLRMLANNVLGGVSSTSLTDEMVG